jgi:arylformamidase
MKKAFISLTAFCLLFLSTTACKKNNIQPEPAKLAGDTTIAYKTVANVAPNLLSLDIYTLANQDPTTKVPIVIWVHGGGWRQGDKKYQVNNKVTLMRSLNYIMVSINYRLSPFDFELNNPNRIKYPTHNNDVADAIRWVYDNIGTYGGDKDKIALLGHSAGAHLVSLTGTSPLFLPNKNLPLTALKGVACIDVDAYDIADISKKSNEDLFINAFGNDPAILKEASPITHLVQGKTYPAFFVAKRGGANYIQNAEAFILKLQNVGATVSQVTANQYDHEGINVAIGAPNETVMTEPLKAFFKQCFK